MFKNSQILNVQNFLTLQVCFQMQKHLEILQAYPFFHLLKAPIFFNKQKKTEKQNMFFRMNPSRHPAYLESLVLMGASSGADWTWATGFFRLANSQWHYPVG